MIRNASRVKPNNRNSLFTFSKLYKFSVFDFAGDESIQERVKYPDDLKTMTKYLLFSAPVVSLPVRGNMVTAVNKALNEAGSLQNIRVWCFPTPEERAIFSNPKLILLGPWGCGKTLFLTAEAIDKDAKGEKSMVLIFTRADEQTTTKPSMLQMDLEEKLKAYSNITVKTVFFVDGQDNNLMEITNDCEHIFIDEMFADIESLTPKSQDELKQLFSAKETVWVAMSNFYYASKLGGSVDLEQWVKAKYPEGFQVAKMNTPLRMPAAVAKNIKDGFSGMSKATQIELNHRLMAECQVPSNLVEGCEMESFRSDQLESLYQLLQQSFEKIPHDSYAMIVIDDRSIISVNDCMRSMIKCNCKNGSSMFWH